MNAYTRKSPRICIFCNVFCCYRRCCRRIILSGKAFADPYCLSSSVLLFPCAVSRFIIRSYSLSVSTFSIHIANNAKTQSLYEIGLTSGSADGNSLIAFSVRIYGSYRFFHSFRIQGTPGIPGYILCIISIAYCLLIKSLILISFLIKEPGITPRLLSCNQILLQIYIH